MPLSGCFSYESNRRGLAEDRSEKRFFPFQPFPGKPVESDPAFSFRTCPDRIGHSGLNVHQTFSAKELANRFGLSRLRRGFEHDKEHDFGGRRKEPQMGESSARLGD